MSQSQAHPDGIYARLGPDSEGGAQLIVPDMVETIPAAVRAAELTHRDTQQAPLMFVRGGEYRWHDTIVIVQKHELDVPPHSEIQPTLINNSSSHWKYDSVIPLVNSTVKPACLRMTGETGALLWGRWHLDQGTSARFSLLQLLTDSRDVASPATVTVVSATVLLEACGIRSVGGACIRVCEAAQILVCDCQIGGLGSLNSERSWVGASVWDSSNCSIVGSSFTQGHAHSAALRACDNCTLSVADSSLSDFGFGLSMSHSSRVVLESSSFANLTYGCISCVDAATAPRLEPTLCLRNNTLACRVWASHQMPLVKQDAGNTLLGNQVSLQEELTELERQDAELGDMLDKLRALGDPDDWQREVENSVSDAQQARVVRLTTKRLDKARSLVMTGLNISTADLERALIDQGISQEQIADMLGPETASDDADHGVTDVSTSDSSASHEHEEGSLAANHRLSLDAMEQSLLTYKRFYERLPAQFRLQEDMDAYQNVPGALDALRSQRRKCFPSDADSLGE